MRPRLAAIIALASLAQLGGTVHSTHARDLRQPGPDVPPPKKKKDLIASKKARRRKT